MKKILFFAVLILALSILPAQASKVFTHNVKTAAGATDISVTATDTVYTSYFVIGDANFFAVSYQGTSALGDPRFTIELEQSATIPATDGAAEAENFSEAVGGSDIVTAFSGTEAVWFHTSFTPLAIEYGRFKITGTSGNHATDTIVNIRLHRQKR